MNNQKALFYAFLAIATIIMAASLFYILSDLKSEKNYLYDISGRDAYRIVSELESANEKFYTDLKDFGGSGANLGVAKSSFRALLLTVRSQASEYRELYRALSEGDKVLDRTLGVMESIENSILEMGVLDTKLALAQSAAIEEIIELQREAVIAAASFDRNQLLEQRKRLGRIYTNAVTLLFGVVLIGGLLAIILFGQKSVLEGMRQSLSRRVEKRTRQLRKSKNLLLEEVEQRKKIEEDLHQFNLTLEHRVRERTHELEEANRAKSEFLSKMGHELRTPLNAIIGLTEMLLEDAEEGVYEDPEEPLARVKKAGFHLLHLINEILDLSKIEAGKIDLFNERIQLQGFLEEVTRTIIPLAKENRNQLELVYSGEPKWIEIDPTRLRQVLYNLLSNACKFTSDGLVELIVAPVTESEIELVAFEVTDTGIGIDEDQMETVFKEFQQIDAGRARNYEGTGLGLTISRNLADLMGGKIKVTSTQGKGSCFTFELPRSNARGSASDLSES